MQQEIIDYIKEITKGVVTITPFHAQHIIDLVLKDTNPNSEQYSISLSRYDSQSGEYNHYITLFKNEVIFNEILVIANNTKEVKEVYRYDFRIGNNLIKRVYCTASLI